MRLAHAMSATPIVSSKLAVQHHHHSRTQHENCRRILKHVLKPYDSRSHNQNGRMTSFIQSLLEVSSPATKVAHDSRKQKSYRVNGP